MNFVTDPCDHCEEMLQPYLDRELTPTERARGRARTSTACDYCRRRYRFEVELRRFVRQSVVEPMAPELKQRLSSLRTPL